MMYLGLKSAGYNIDALYLFDKLKGIKNYFCILAILASGFMLIDFIDDRYVGIILEISGIFDLISGLRLLPLITSALWLIVIILHVMDCRQKQPMGSNIGMYIWLGKVIIVDATIIYILYNANFRGNGERYGALQSYVVIDNREYIWILAMRIYNGFPLSHRIFGFGPDTFGILTVTPYRYVWTEN